MCISMNCSMHTNNSDEEHWCQHCGQKTVIRHLVRTTCRTARSDGREYPVVDWGSVTIFPAPSEVVRMRNELTKWIDSASGQNLLSSEKRGEND